MDSVQVPLSSATGVPATLTIARLPRAADGPELDTGHGRAFIREGRSYRFEFDLPSDIEDLQPSELFDADDAGLTSGRLLPGEAVGLVTVRASTKGGEVFAGEFDVRAAKFSDERAFGDMLSDLAAQAVEALHQGFAPSAGAFSASTAAEPRLLYQQFAVLQSLLAGEDLQWAIQQVLAQPQRAWESTYESRQPGRPLRGSSRLSAQVTRPGPRVPTPRANLRSLPAALQVERTEETLDTPANRGLLHG